MALIPFRSSTVITLKFSLSIFKTARFLPLWASAGIPPKEICKKNVIKSKFLGNFPKLVNMKTLAIRCGLRSLNSKNYLRTGNYYTSKCAIHSSSSPPEENREKGRWLPSIMPFPPVMWPRLINSIRNWFFIHFVIKPYFDREFDILEFDRGARQAVSYVSNKLSSGEFDGLEGLVEASALEEIKKSVSTFSLFQRDLIKVAVEDVFFSFPYQIGIIIPDQPTDSDRYVEGGPKPKQVRHVEITVVLHVLRGYAEKQKAEDSKSFVEFIQDDATKYNVMVCNYRFFRDFTEDVKNPAWIINMVNHFLPTDIQRIQLRK